MNEWREYYRQGLNRIAFQERVTREVRRLEQEIGRSLQREEVAHLEAALREREMALDFWAPWRLSGSVLFVLLAYLAWVFLSTEAVTPTLLCVGGAGYCLFLAIKAHLQVRRARAMRLVKQLPAPVK